MWFNLSGDMRLGACTTDRCGGQPTWRLESGGIGSDYCSGCKEIIERIGTDDPNRVYDARIEGFPSR